MKPRYRKARRLQRRVWVCPRGLSHSSWSCVCGFSLAIARKIRIEYNGDGAAFWATIPRRKLNPRGLIIVGEDDS